MNHYLKLLLPSTLLCLLAACGGDDVASGEPRVLHVNTLKAVQEENYERGIRFLGLVEADQQSNLAFELPGTVEWISVDEGDAVEKGQELAHLDDSRLQARLIAEQAAVNEARATLQLAESTLRRQERLVAADAASEQVLDEARQARDVARAGIARLQALVDTTQVDIDKSILNAPYNGVIIQRYIDPGASIGPATPILKLLNLDALEIRVGVSPELLRKLARRDPVVFLPGSDEPLFVADVLRVLPQRDRGMRTIDVVLKADPAAGLRPGDTVEVSASEIINTPGFWVPRSSITENIRGLWAVLVVVDSERGPVVERRPVELIHFDENRAYVSGPLKAGELIVANGLQRITPGQRVEPVIEE